MKADIAGKTFAAGLLPELIAALRHSRPGDLVALAGEDESQPSDRFTATNLMSQMPRSRRPGFQMVGRRSGLDHDIKQSRQELGTRVEPSTKRIFYLEEELKMKASKSLDRPPIIISPP
jgi:hypothetical protein